MPLITLISDWSGEDYYVAAVKGTIMKCNGSIQIVDITHQVPAFNIGYAAFILGNSYSFFPKGTVHLVCINTDSGLGDQYLIAQSKGHYFIACDNGIFGLLFPEDPEKVFRIEKFKPVGSFAVIDVLVPAACHLAQGAKPEAISTLVHTWKKQVPLLPVFDEATISGSVVYIDSYRNAITNIHRTLFDRIGQGRRFDILVQSNHYRINRINSSYLETTSGELLALFNTSGYLEIAICNGNAADLLNLDTRSVIRIKFYNKQNG